MWPRPKPAACAGTLPGLARRSSSLESWLAVSFQSLRRAFERGPEHRQLLARPLPVTLVERFIHSRDHHRRVAGIFAGRVNYMAIPRTMRQALRRQQRALCGAQSLVQARSIGRRILLPGEDFRARGLEMVSRGVYCAEVERVVAELISRPPARSVEIYRNLFPVFLVVIGQNVGSGHAHGFQSKDAGHLLFIGEVRIGELLEPRKIIEHGVVHAIRTA